METYGNGVGKLLLIQVLALDWISQGYLTLL